MNIPNLPTTLQINFFIKIVVLIFLCFGIIYGLFLFNSINSFRRIVSIKPTVISLVPTILVISYLLLAVSLFVIALAIL